MFLVPFHTLISPDLRADPETNNARPPRELMHPVESLTHIIIPDLPM
jgi:hypothetical protein